MSHSGSNFIFYVLNEQKLNTQASTKEPLVDNRPKKVNKMNANKYFEQMQKQKEEEERERLEEQR